MEPVYNSLSPAKMQVHRITKFLFSLSNSQKPKAIQYAQTSNTLQRIKFWIIGIILHFTGCIFYNVRTRA